MRPRDAAPRLTHGCRKHTLFLSPDEREVFDCGPMSGFERGLADAAFFPDGECRSILGP